MKPRKLGLRSREADLVDGVAKALSETVAGTLGDNIDASAEALADALDARLDDLPYSPAFALLSKDAAAESVGKMVHDAELMDVLSSLAYNALHKVLQRRTRA